MTRRRRLALIVLVFALLASGGAIVAFDQMKQDATRQLLAAHEARARCLVSESAKLPACQQFKDGRRPEDFDYCASAVTVCTDNGRYAAARAADEAYADAMMRSVASRQVAAVLAAVLILGAALWGVIGVLRR